VAPVDFQAAYGKGAALGVERRPAPRGLGRRGRRRVGPMSDSTQAALAGTA